MTEHYISGMAYKLGEPCQVAQLHDYEIDHEVLKFFEKSGFEHYRRFTDSVEAAIAQSVRATLTAAAVKGEDVDAVIFASPSFNDEDKISAALAGEGIVSAQLIGLSLGGCGLIAPAVAIAGQLLREMRRVLVVVCDHYLLDPQRIITTIGIGSDAVASFMVSVNPTGPALEIAAVAQQRYPVTTLPEEQWQKRWTLFNDNVLALFNDFYAGENLQADDIQHFFTNNYTNSLLQLYLSLSKIKRANLHVGDIANNGHCGSADTIINLDAAVVQAGIVQAGDKVLLLSTGMNNWGIVYGRWSDSSAGGAP